MIRKSELKLVKPDTTVLLTPPKVFDFNGEDSPEMLSNLMLERLAELGGLGLSANQVGLNYRMFVMGAGESQYSIFNPEIISMSQEHVIMDEGCLSFPGIYIKVSRPSSIGVRFQNKKGEVREETLTGLTARIFLHEYDHMEGITLKQKVSKIKWDLAFNRFTKRTNKIIRKGVQSQLVNIANKIKEENVSNT
jgi:peptide deformylase